MKFCEDQPPLFTRLVAVFHRSAPKKILLQWVVCLVICCAMQSCSSKEDAAIALVVSVMEHNGALGDVEMEMQHPELFDDSIFVQMSDEQLLSWVRDIDRAYAKESEWVTLKLATGNIELFHVRVQDLHSYRWIEFRFIWQDNQWRIFSINLREGHH